MKHKTCAKHFFENVFVLHCYTCISRRQCEILSILATSQNRKRDSFQNHIRGQRKTV